MQQNVDISYAQLGRYCHRFQHFCVGKWQAIAKSLRMIIKKYIRKLPVRTFALKAGHFGERLS